MALTHTPGEEIHPLLETTARDLMKNLTEQGYDQLTDEDVISIIASL